LTAAPRPSRGEVWSVDLNLTRGREQAGRRPALVVSTDRFNHGPAELVVVVPLTSVDKRIPLHIRIEPDEGGVRTTSYAKPEDVRSISTRRLGERWGAVSTETMRAVESRLRVLLEL
jgi:mRNA interferase MazF